MIAPAHKVSHDQVNEPQLDHLCSTINHLAIIPDGDRRWAREQGLPDSYGHLAGFTQAALNLLSQLLTLNIHTITFWCNSLENLKRDQREVLNAMDAFTVTIKKMIPIAQRHGTKIVYFGTKELVPEGTLNALIESEKITRHNILNIGVNYSGRHEALRVTQRLINENISPESITSDLITSYTDLGKQPYPQPDLILHLGKAKRLSDFMNLQSGYSELFFSEKLFPEFSCHDLQKAIGHFGNQKRRFRKN